MNIDLQQNKIQYPSTLSKTDPLSFSTQEFNISFAREELINEIFEAQAKISPNKTAIISQDIRLSYKELDEEANHLAQLLQSKGIGKKKVVAIYLPRGSEIIITLLAILKAGATYLPLDSKLPMDRAGYSIADSGATLLITTPELIPNKSSISTEVLYFQTIIYEAKSFPKEKPSKVETQATPNDIAYIIYTSGTTGRPKGISISHRNICNFTRSAQSAYMQIIPDDIVFQGFSIAFDAAQEEIWPTFLGGGTLYIANEKEVMSGEDLANVINTNGISVLSCVPTLVSMIKEEVPSLRLLVLGGETCPPELVKRWWKPTRKIVNSYGPTETTVACTYMFCTPDTKVTIGKSLPNYYCYVLNDELKPIQIGEVGELCVSGIGIAQGYLNNPELTTKKFIANPFYKVGFHNPTLYRTGDLASWTPNGTLEILGRNDEQIKLRGYRIEISEIEEILLKNPNIQAAAVCIRNDIKGIDQLVAFVVLKQGFNINRQELIQMMNKNLPHYMVPHTIETLNKLPLLVSGKINRSALLHLKILSTETNNKITLPKNIQEKDLLREWKKLFPNKNISTNDNFFTDLGGHSLLAARLISKLRSYSHYSHASMHDIYKAQTISELAERLKQTPGQNKTNKEDKINNQTSQIRYYLCGIAQAFGLTIILGIYALQILLPYLTYALLVYNDVPVISSILASVTACLSSIPIILLITLALKWLIVGKFKQGDYPLWGTYYLRWWFINRLLNVTPVSLFSGTPFIAIYLRLLGANIGENVIIQRVQISSPDLITIGNDTIISNCAILSTSNIENGFLKLRCISIGAGCYMGTTSVVSGESEIKDGAILGNLSFLPAKTIIPSNEEWHGSPAKRNSNRSFPLYNPNLQSHKIKRLVYGVIFFMLALSIRGLLLLPILPGIVWLNYLQLSFDYEWYDFLYLVNVMALVPLLLTSTCLLVALIKWTVLGYLKPGVYKLYTGFHIRKWFLDELMHSSSDLINTFYATLYLIPWFKLLGVKVGERAEISTSPEIAFDLVSIGQESFVADLSTLCAPRVYNNEFTLAPTIIGQRAFIGNNSVLSSGTIIPDGTLIGVLSVPPKTDEDLNRSNVSWLGSPAIFLPRREHKNGFTEATTYKPSRKLYLQRLFIEYFRITLPLTTTIILISLLFSLIDNLLEQASVWQTILLFPVLYMFICVIIVFLAVTIKKLLVGKYCAIEKPLWSNFVWRNELLTTYYENTLVPFFLDHLRGTPFINIFLRILGCKIGKRVFIDTTDITEHDMITIGDDAIINENATLQSHLFEDRIIKIGPVTIGANCSVGSLSVILYNTEMQAGSELGDLSVLMKGETLPKDTKWQGLPAHKIV